MDVVLYSFAKKLNSTKQPSIGGETYQCYLKHPCSVLSPSITLQTGITAAPSFYNYAHIPAFNRYYYINDWVSEGNFWVANMAVDPLASWKVDIGAHTDYILRAESQYDGNILDTTYPTLDTYTTTTELNPVFRSNLTAGDYIIGIINDDDSAIGSVSYYVLDNAQMRALCTSLLSNVDWANVTDISSELLKTVFNPFQYIVSCMWFPFSVPHDETIISSIKLGWWEFAVSAYRLGVNTKHIITQTNIQVPKHFQSAVRGNYLNLAPYTSHTLYFPPFGAVELDTTKLFNASTFSVAVYVDLISGIACLRVITSVGGGAYTLAEKNILLAVPIQLAQISTDVMGTATSAVNTISNSIGSIIRGDIGGAITNAATGISSTVQASAPTVNSAGVNGSTLSTMFTPYLETTWFGIANQDLTTFGAPLCKHLAVNKLSGYVLCAHGDVESAATEQELNAIRDYLTGGFYYE